MFVEGYTIKGEKAMSYLITDYVHQFVTSHIQNGSICVDATAGNGNDTVFLCEHAGMDGKVFAFDIQEAAIENTKKRVKESGYQNAEIIFDSHVNMKKYLEEKSVDCILFNFGYLPGGNHAIATKASTSIEAIKEGLDCLKKDGIMGLCIYSGKDSGFEEKEAILNYLKQIDSKKYLVLVTEYYNRVNHPPIPAFIIRLK